MCVLVLCIFVLFLVTSLCGSAVFVEALSVMTFYWFPSRVGVGVGVLRGDFLLT